MSNSREDEFIEAWGGSPREELEKSDVDAALAAYRALRAPATDEAEADYGSSVEGAGAPSAEMLEKQISQITQQIPKPTARVVDLGARKKDQPKESPSYRGSRWFGAVGAMAACFALVVGLNFYNSRPQQSDDWGQQIVYRGNSEPETIDQRVSVVSPRKSARQLGELLQESGATYRLNKQSGSDYRVVFKLSEIPEAKLTARFAELGVDVVQPEKWYVLSFEKQ